MWHSGLTLKQSNEIERIQKLALKIILQANERACGIFSALTLKERRNKLCLKFAKKNLKSEHNIFELRTNGPITRNQARTVVEPKCNFSRYKKSSIPFLAGLLNTNMK